MNKSIPKSEQRANVIYDYIKYRFKNPKLLEQAFTTPSAVHHKLTNLKESFQRLEFLGDSILKTVISDLIYHLLPDAKEGELSKKRSELEKNKALHKISERLKLTEFVIKKETDKYNSKLDADLVEAIIGAIFIDTNDYSITKFYTLNLIRENIFLDFEEALINEYLNLLGTELNIYHNVSKSLAADINDQANCSQTPFHQEADSSYFTQNGAFPQENINNFHRNNTDIPKKRNEDIFNNRYQNGHNQDKNFVMEQKINFVNLVNDLNLDSGRKERIDEKKKIPRDKRFNAFENYCNRSGANNKNQEIEMELDDIDKEKTPYRANPNSKFGNNHSKFFDINYIDSCSD